ncbi:MAG: SusC/RagA family TonB-linked outer membrane protein [Bacteroidales bacterium]
MKNKLISLLFLFTFLNTISLFSQEGFRVTGKVLDENGEPLIGVNVIEKETTIGTVTDLDGNFELIVSGPGSILVFSFIGYLNEEIPLNGQNELQVSLVPDLQELDEVVVIGYGTVKKEDLTGSVELAETKGIEKLSLFSTEQAIQGKVSGVFVAASSGAPGSPVSVRIRGVGTPNNADPLYIVDGMPIKDASTGKNDNPSGINFLNPSDIESIQILKDASATAIYGTRGANGVVIITTKQGLSGQPRVNFNGYYSIQNLPEYVRPDMLNAQQWATLYNEVRGETYNPDTIPFLKTTDWQDQVFRTAITHSEQFNISGGAEKNKYFVSFNNFSQEGIVRESNYNRISGRVNTEFQINDWLKVGEKFSITSFENRRQKEEGLHAGGVVGSPIAAALMADPTIPPYNEEGELSYVGERTTVTISNPIGIYQRHHYIYNNNRIQGTAFAEISPLENLTYKFNVGLDRSWGFREEVWPQYEIAFDDASENTTLFTEHEDWFNYLIENTVNYRFSINDNHNFNLLLGYTVQEENLYREVATSFLPYTENDLLYHSARESNSDIIAQYGAPEEWALMSYLGRLNYSFNDKYLLTASVRRDGSSRFGENRRWGVFPSVAFAWKISEEPFMQNVASVSMLKLRGGWGEVGNQNIGLYRYTASTTYKPDPGLPGPVVFYGNPAVPYPAVVIDGIANPNIGWESTKTFNIGLDIALWQNRLYSTIDLYDKTTTDLLLYEPVPLWAASGYLLEKSGQITNAGEINNKGIDFSLSYKNSIGKIHYNIGGNISYIKNNVVALEGGAPLTSDTKFPVKVIKGEPLGVFWGYKVDGIFQSEEEVEQHAVQESRTGVGDLKFRDINEDGVISSDDQTVIGYALPNFTYGLNANLSYKNFELNVFAQGVQGNDIANMARQAIYHNFRMTSNVSTDMLKYYGRELENGEIITDTDIPRITFPRDNNNNDRNSDYFLEDGSYLRIKTVTLSYNIPENLYEVLGLNNFQVYVTVENLYTFSKYSGYNPEIGTSSSFNANPLAFGIDNATYPIPRTFLFGLNIGL